MDGGIQKPGSTVFLKEGSRGSTGWGGTVIKACPLSTNSVLPESCELDSGEKDQRTGGLTRMRGGRKQGEKKVRIFG